MVSETTNERPGSLVVSMNALNLVLSLALRWRALNSPGALTPPHPLPLSRKGRGVKGSSFLIVRLPLPYVCSGPWVALQPFRSAEIFNSPLSPCGRGAGGEGYYPTKRLCQRDCEMRDLGAFPDRLQELLRRNLGGPKLQHDAAGGKVGQLRGFFHGGARAISEREHRDDRVAGSGHVVDGARHAPDFVRHGRRARPR